MDEIAERVARRFLAVVQVIPDVAKSWAGKYEAALKSNGAGNVDVELVYGGNVRTTIKTTLDGNPVPDIVVDEELVRPNYHRLRWVRIDSGPGAKFIKSPTAMAKYVIENYL